MEKLKHYKPAFPLWKLVARLSWSWPMTNGQPGWPGSEGYSPLSNNRFPCKGDWTEPDHSWVFLLGEGHWCCEQCTLTKCPYCHEFASFPYFFITKSTFPHLQPTSTCSFFDISLIFHDHNTWTRTTRSHSFLSLPPVKMIIYTLVPRRIFAYRRLFILWCQCTSTHQHIHLPVHCSRWTTIVLLRYQWECLTNLF